MKVEEFLDARLDELQDAIEFGAVGKLKEQLLALIQTDREILELHKAWVMLVETRPRFEKQHFGDSISLQMTSSLMWVTREEYTKRFGPEAPCAPFIRSMLTHYRDHPDFDELWLNGLR